ncbi:hypothetical protein RJ641_036490 [Dillenia turbinata]|uniref:Uncharacterized protein n=1 Tax=Dillenia turbinata TaxID=194707 RepID=A0AAN8VPV6_9MAGN
MHSFATKHTHTHPVFNMGLCSKRKSRAKKVEGQRFQQCAGKLGLLLSTVNTLEALGLEIQKCVISCFNDLSVQASSSEEAEQRCLINSENIKQVLFRNAGYGGRSL